MKNRNKTILFACNEGGHFSQMMALSPLFEKYDSVLLTDNKRASKKMKALKNIKEIEFAMAYANRRSELTNKHAKNITPFSYAIAYLKLIGECYNVWKKYKPSVVITTGSNIAVPLAFISKLGGSKFVFIETRAKVYSKTKTGILVGWLSDKIIVQWPEMMDVYNGEAEYYGTLV